MKVFKISKVQKHNINIIWGLQLHIIPKHVQVLSKIYIWKKLCVCA